MKLLEQKIRESGIAIGSEILKVDSFLNHMIDVRFMDEIGREIADIYAGRNVNKILTVEASGIVIGTVASQHMGYPPVVFAKKAKPSTMTEDSYESEARSFTKGTSSMLRVSKRFLGPDDRVVIVDDFLAMGEAGCALVDICKQAGAEIVGFTAVIEKKAQGGADRLRSLGIDVNSLAVVEKMEDGKVYFKED